MGIPKYDDWKLSGPVDVVVDKCGSCETELFEGQEVYYDGDFMQNYCNKKCFKDHVVANIDEYIDVVIDELSIKKRELERETV